MVVFLEETIDTNFHLVGTRWFEQEMFWVYMLLSVRSKLLIILLPVSHVLMIKRRFCSKVLLLGIFKYQNSTFLLSFWRLFMWSEINWRIYKNRSTKYGCNRLLVTIQGQFRFDERNACDSAWFGFRFIDMIWKICRCASLFENISCFNCRFSNYNFRD